MNNLENINEKKLLVIKPASRLMPIGFGEILQNKELFWYLIKKNIKVRYKQTFLGMTWAALVPIVQMIIFTLIFGYLAGLPTDGLKPQLYYFAGLVPWTYFATSLQLSTSSLINDQRLITKIYFPRVLLPASFCISPLLDFLIGLVLLLGMMVFYGSAVGINIIFLPLFLLMIFIIALGGGLFFSSLSVKYRDVSFVVPFIVQIWMYISVIYPYSSLPESLGQWRVLYGINPMAGAIEGFRWSLLGTASLPPEMIGLSLLSMLMIFIAGIINFKRMEKYFADVI